VPNNPHDVTDRELSTRISPRAHRPQDNEGLRRLIVNRLSDTNKAVARLSLRRNEMSMYCEPCKEWSTDLEEEFPEEWRCPRCRRLYLLEFAILKEVDEG
jgi:hypothetical protein